jgi:tRNA A-37 threonylcarbamoyl transferase component Bud32
MVKTPAIPQGLPVAGDVIAGKYELVRVLGEGAMGIVYEANHMRLGQRLAIKVLKPELAHMQDVLARFQREARASAQLQSINVARVSDVDVLPSGLPYIVLEFLEGHDLGVELEHGGPLAIETAVDYVQQVASAMEEAHRLGIIHRDLKPSNLFLCRTPSETRQLVKVLDFGISKVARETGARLTMQEESLGTPWYMAPEQLRSASGVDARADIWSLGVILFELLTGRMPFEGSPTSVIAAILTEPVPSPTRFRPELPLQLVGVIAQALEKDPALRIHSMSDLMQRLAPPFAPKADIASVMPEPRRPADRLGDILLADGLVSAEELERALAEQRRTGKRLGRVLIDAQLVTEVELLAALAKQQGLVVSPESGRAAPRHRRRRSALAIALAAAVPLAGVGALAVHAAIGGAPESALHTAAWGMAEPASATVALSLAPLDQPATAVQAVLAPAARPQASPPVAPRHALAQAAAPKPKVLFDPSAP